MNIESQTLLQLGIVYISANFLKFVIFTGIILFLIRWFIGGTKNVFGFYERWVNLGFKKRAEEIKQDEINWSTSIDDRVRLLNKLKSTETSIRHELDQLHEVKVVKENVKK